MWNSFRTNDVHAQSRMSTLKFWPNRRNPFQANYPLFLVKRSHIA